MNWGNASPLSSTTTGLDGSFRLGGVPHGEVFLFAEAPGYRFRGVSLSTGKGTARLVLARSDEPPSRALPIQTRPTLAGDSLAWPSA